MKRLFFLLFFSFINPINNQMWGWGNGYPNPPPAPPNNNIGIGYPTAYSLYIGKGGGGGGWGGGWGGGGWGGGGDQYQSGKGLGFPTLKCENGGAHIGQCRLDQDAICIALGGTCVNGACCTTPFSALGGGGKTGNGDRPLTTVEGDVEPGSIISEKSNENEEWERRGSGLVGEMGEKGRVTRPPLGTTPQPYTERTRKPTTHQKKVVTVKPEDEEMEELFEILGSSTPKPTKSTWKKKNKGKKGKTTTTITAMATTTSLPTHLSLLLTTCSSGLRPVGPCAEDSDCPTLHHCQNNQICCYNIFHFDEHSS